MTLPGPVRVHKLTKKQTKRRWRKKKRRLVISIRLLKRKDDMGILCRYVFECFSFFVIAVLFSAGNAKKNVFTVFTVPIVTIDAYSLD